MSYVLSNLSFRFLCHVSLFNVIIRFLLKFNFVTRVSSNLNFLIFVPNGLIYEPFSL